MRPSDGVTKEQQLGDKTSHGLNAALARTNRKS
jgi:hypothetical protein